VGWANQSCLPVGASNKHEVKTCVELLNSISKFRETKKIRNKAKLNEKDAKQNSKLVRLSET
jgi:hypothetical protein